MSAVTQGVDPTNGVDPEDPDTWPKEDEPEAEPNEDYD